MGDISLYDKRDIPPLIYRLMVWGVLFTVLYVLHSFFLLIFLTFVFAYLQVSVVNFIQKRWIGHRKLCVIVTAIALLCFLISVLLFLIPSVKRQTERFITQFGTYIDRVDEEVLTLSHRHQFIKDIVVQLELTESNGTNNGTDGSRKAADSPQKAKESPVRTLIQQVIGFGSDTNGTTNINQLLEKFRNISGQIVSVGSAFLLSLLLSFLIVFDLPNLTKLVTDLENTRLSFFYREVANNIKEFAHVLGKALEAQLFIAIINSIMTAFGLYFLSIGKYIAFLSVIVFFCSFIPVVGVFVSSVPICLVTLQASGLKTMLLAILLITGIHLIEGYILNPRIYGTYMRINPVLVLIILTIGGKLFHIWGLILGVPVCTYVFAHAIRRKKPQRDPDLQDQEQCKDDLTNRTAC